MLANFIFSFMLGTAMVRPIREMIRRAGHLRPNYTGRSIPTSSGISLVASATVASVGTLALGLADRTHTVSCLLLVVSAALVGVVDDLVGSCKSKGITGHIRALVVEGKLTTGTLKAIVILAAAAASVYHAAGGSSPANLAVGSVIIALSANFINLLDLRPARAAKGFLAGVIALLAAGSPDPAVVPIAMAGATLAGLKDELEERSMIGDAGSNPLGAAIGYWVALGTHPAVKAAVLALLLTAHIWAESHSLTRAIERNPILRFLDNLGRW
ncbi:MAG: hypothetical protein AB1774_01525 [Bacillota bacterium]